MSSEAYDHAKERRKAHKKWLEDIIKNPSPELQRKLKRVNKLRRFQGR